MNGFGVVLCCLASAGGGFAAAELFGKRISAAAECGAKAAADKFAAVIAGTEVRVRGDVKALHDKVYGIKPAGVQAGVQAISTVKSDAEGVHEAVADAFERAKHKLMPRP